ncbi:MAG: DUF1553 domain-containing protein [Pirellulales bacterium]
MAGGALSATEALYADEAAPDGKLAASKAAEHFERVVRPIFAEHCTVCHGEDTQEADVRLDVPDKILGISGAGALVVPGDPEHSRLIQLVRGTAEMQMPPDDRLPPEAVAALEQWVREGAVWPGYEKRQTPSTGAATPSATAHFTPEQKAYWAFQRVRDPSQPPVTNAAWPRNPIDHFILARLEAAGIGPSPPADKRTLLRRVTYDLTGLPPTSEELAAFIADNSPDAFAKVVDRLLASPQYGEKWGQHWLDAVRFAESAGHDGNNAYLHAWRYRDYVVRSFNADKPYDKFLVEQLAGDLLPKSGDAQQDFDRVVATGFLQVGPKPVVMRDKHQMLLEIADEQVHTIGVSMLGLTLGCARCHDHKFDPIPTADYYSLAGILTSTKVMADAAPDSKWCEKDIAAPDGEPAEVMTVEDLPDPKNLQIHLRGNYRSLGAEAPRRFLQIIAGEGHAAIQTSGSGRLELARWIASATNPLTARVMVNRIWQHHFGRGIVATSDNFGRVGELPTHPDLLDWLAARFVDNGWSIKAMHRLMLLSSTYQQACLENAASAAVDPENHLLWRMPRRRLRAEEVRDSMLAVTGGLDRSAGGTLFTEGYQPGDETRKLYVVDISNRDPFPPFQSARRSIYLPILRNARPEILKLFDVANEQAPTAVRGETTVAPQALFLLNSPFVRDRAQDLAAYLLSQLPDAKPEDWQHVAIDNAYRAVLGRDATAAEHQAVMDFLASYQEQIQADSSPARDPAELIKAAREHYDQATRQETGLLGYYRFDGVEFDGASQALRVDLPPRESNVGRSLSIEFWMKPTDFRTATAAGADGPEGRLWRMGIETRGAGDQQANYPFYEFYPPNAGGRVVVADSQAVVRSDRWTHVLATIGGGRRVLYVNGRKVHEAETGAALRPFNLPLVIGARGDRNEWFRGGIDHVALYDRVLDEGDVRRRFGMFEECHWKANDVPELFAWRAFCQTLLCSNEFMYLE